MVLKVNASVTSTTHERKSKTTIVTKHGKFFLRHNAFGCVHRDLHPHPGIYVEAQHVPARVVLMLPPSCL